MALIACTDCGRQVSEIAAACPQCGRPISQRPIQAQIVTQQRRPGDEPTVGDAVKGAAKAAWSVPVAVLIAPFVFFIIWLASYELIEFARSIAINGYGRGFADPAWWSAPVSLLFSVIFTVVVMVFALMKKSPAAGG